MSHVPPGDAFPAVSFHDEKLVLVDSQDRVTGRASKARVHAGAGLLHRAFSVFLWDCHDRLLIHRRSESKPLWPGYWTNSCCSHPRSGETLENSVHRRIREELGCEAATLDYVCAFEYHAAYRDIGSEHELCHIYLARLAPGDSIRVHPMEISEITWCTLSDVDEMMRAQRDDLTPWFRLEWKLLRGQRRKTFERFLDAGGNPVLADPSVA